MIHWLGLVIGLLGMAAGSFVFVLNSQTPVQLGPIPFFGSCAMVIVGLVMLLWRT